MVDGSGLLANAREGRTASLTAAIDTAPIDTAAGLFAAAAAIGDAAGRPVRRRLAPTTGCRGIDRPGG